ncbi:MAG: aminotransferase class I/II-fold pyridoxal phosphate-dependent enzyme [Pseudohongiellaceae bacterium]
MPKRFIREHSVAGHAVADRNDQLRPFRVMKVMQRAMELEAQGRHIIHMEVGEPDFITPQPVIDAACVAMAAGKTGYTDAAGIPSLRQAISDHYLSRHNLAIPPRRIFITPGGSGGLNLLANLLIQRDDGVLMADPGYPCNPNFVRLAGGEPQFVPVNAKGNFQPEPAALEASRRSNTRGVWLASPANPTGAVIPRNALKTIVQWCREREMHLLVDEIYHGLHYVDDLPTVLALDDQSFVVNSFSKYFGMTGWRLGWIVVPESRIQQVEILMQNMFICASSISQHAALAAFQSETLSILNQRRQAFRERRDYLVVALRDIGFEVSDVQGAFYVYAGIGKFADDSEKFCETMLAEHGVAITPGTDFGTHLADTHVRFAFTTSLENLQQAIERLRHALRRHGPDPAERP